MHLAHELGLLHQNQLDLADAYDQVAASHVEEPDVHALCTRLSGRCRQQAQQLQPFVDRYGESASEEPDKLETELFHGPRRGPLGLLRDLQDLSVLVHLCSVTWVLIGQAAQALRDRELLEVVTWGDADTAEQRRWLMTRMKQAAPQVLVTAGPPIARLV